MRGRRDRWVLLGIVDAYLEQATAFPLGIGVLSLWRSLRSRS
jgi:hypothetical protein